MKMKQISDSTIKITIQLEDLEERGMEIADFLVPQEKTEEFFPVLWGCLVVYPAQSARDGGAGNIRGKNGTGKKP